jgi:2-succinyl-5-enolpyruvyl-6-hydroxy-3-cyclohexene-1-carboxylate synthase
VRERVSPNAPWAPNGPWAKVLVDELARAGLRHAVIAPGSRSTPLVLALAGHPDVADLSVIDERSAAFYALGLARATGRPAAVVTTSGTAAANLLPAAVEADRSGVPLLLLTADRPPERRDAGDSQAIDQVTLFGGFARWFHGVAEPSLEAGRLAYLRSTAREAWGRATGAAGGGTPGPVHLNLPFRKPLEPTSDDPAAADPRDPAAKAEEDSTDPLAKAEEGGGGNLNRHGGYRTNRRLDAPTGAPDPAVVEELALALAGATRPVVLAGAIADAPGQADLEPLRAAVARLMAVLPLPVWAEATSNLRVVSGVVATADLLLASAGFRNAICPGEGPDEIDLVLRLGEAPVTWPLRRFVGDLTGAEHWAIDRWGRRHDPEHAVQRSIAADPARTLDAVAGWLERHRPPRTVRDGWLALHRRADRAARAALGEGEGNGSFFDGGVFPRLARHLPEDAALVVSSSMPLRELEAFFVPPVDPDRRIDVFANRGVNGIDGVTSTAAGIAEGRRVGSDSRTVLVTGDVAFTHDLSGALAAGRLASDLTVILIDNGGGAIFDHLPLAALPEHRAAFERHFTTPPGADFEALARGLGWSYEAPDDWESFDRAFEAAARVRPPRLIHVRTDRERAKRLREELTEKIAAAIDRSLEEPDDPEPAGPAPSTAPGSGQAPAGHPVPVLLLHGFTGSGDLSGGGMAPLAGRLAAAGHPVIAPDLPGHGAAGVPENGATLEAAVATALAALDRRGVQRAAWVGYSMGGRVALAAALEHPDRVAGLVLLSASPGIESDAERAARREADEALARSLETDGLAAFADRWTAHPLFATETKLGHRHLRRARAERLAGSARGYTASLRGMGQAAQPSLWARLGEVRARTHLIAGEEDEKYLDIVRRMAEAIPDAEIATVSGAGHAVHREAPDPVARAILEYLGRLGGQ